MLSSRRRPTTIIHGAKHLAARVTSTMSFIAAAIALRSGSPARCIGPVVAWPAGRRVDRGHAYGQSRLHPMASTALHQR
jgi:hypothetical protein